MIGRQPLVATKTAICQVLIDAGFTSYGPKPGDGFEVGAGVVHVFDQPRYEVHVMPRFDRDSWSGLDALHRARDTALGKYLAAITAAGYGAEIEDSWVIVTPAREET